VEEQKKTFKGMQEQLMEMKSDLEKWNEEQTKL